MAIRSTKQVTIPTTPNSHLSRRLGQKIRPKVVLKKEKVQEEKPLGLTLMEPFCFESDKRALIRGDIHANMAVTKLTAAEQMQKYFKDSRSHNIPTNACKQLTEGKAFSLHTDKRSLAHARSLPMSTDEQEIEFIKSLELTRFKARPVNKRLFRNTDMGLKKVEAKAATIPVEFHLETNARPPRKLLEPESTTGLEKSSVCTSSSMDATTFKALPMPDFSAASSQRSVAPPRRLTIANSPKLSGGRRASSAPARRQQPHHSLVEQQRAAALAADIARVGARPSSPLTLTEPMEFQFESAARGLAHQAVLEGRLRREEEEAAKAREVHANPVPINVKPFVTKPSSKELTDFDEFRLRSLDRHEQAEEKFNEQLKKEEAELKKEFRALALPKAILESGFVLEHQPHVLVVPRPVILESELRAARRKEFDSANLERQRQQEVQQAQLEKLNAEKENTLVRELRGKSVTDGGMKFVAAPVLTADLYPTKLMAPPPLTDPKSPFLRAKLRPRALSTVNLNSTMLLNAPPASTPKKAFVI